MGYYIQATTNKNKTAYLIDKLSGTEVMEPAMFSDIPPDKALIVIVDNGSFEAAGLAYNENEFRVFTNPRDHRSKRFVLIDKELAHNLANYHGGK